MDSKEEKYMRSLSFEEMTNYMRIQANTPFEAWREVLSLVDKDVRQKEIQRVEKVVKRAETSLEQEGIEIPLRSAREDLMLEMFPYVEDILNKSTMEMAFHYLRKEDWGMFERIVLTNNYAKQITFDYLLEAIPDDRKYDLTVNVYI